MELIPATLVDRLLAALPSDLHEPIREGLGQVQAPAMEVALAAWRAEQEELPFAAAVRDDTNFLALARLHYGWLDLLQYELSPELAEQLRAGLRRAAGCEFGPVRKELFLVAAKTAGPTGSLLRFLLREVLYANVLLAARRDDGSLEASGCLSAIESEVQRVLEESLADAQMQVDDVRPLETMFADLWLRLDAMWNAVAPTVAKATAEFRDQFEMLAEASRRAKLAGAADAAIIRTVFDQELDGERVGSQRLADRHPLVFTSAEGVDQQRSRLHRHWLAGKQPCASGIRLVDILFEDLSEEG